MNEKYILAVDQSTQGTKAILFDASGNVFCRCDIPHKQYIDENGWVSHDLEEIYQNTLQAVKNVVEKSQISKEQIHCLGISNQRETSAIWNRETGLPLAKAVVWQCARAKDICQRVKEQGKGEKIRQRTGMQLSPYFPASKYAWLKENVPEINRLMKEGKLCFGTIDTWLLFCLTKGKVYATDYSNASRTQLFNIHTLKWDEEICEWFGIQNDCLPDICDSNSWYGETDLEGFLDNPIPICGVIGDSQGALFAQGCIEKGAVKATYGTGSSVMMNIGDNPILSDLGLVTSIAWSLDGKVNYVFEGNINYTGAVISWLIQNLNLIEKPGETQKLAFAANEHDTTYLIPAFTGLGAPYWKTEAKAAIVGMSRMTGKCEIVKAALESIAYQITDVIEMMKTENKSSVKSLCVDGGATHNQYLMKFQSNILGIPIMLPKCEESSAQGAAYIAGLKSGFYSFDQIFSEEKQNSYMPHMIEKQRYEKYLGWKNAVKQVI